MKAKEADQELPAVLLERAYRHGYFPMSDPESGNIHWFRPDPRAIIPLESFSPSRSLRKSIRNSRWRFSANEAFLDVMKACDRPRESWMTEAFFAGYSELHGLGKAASIEVWEGKDLVGGVYGVCLGAAFFAESKFHRKTDASKAALYQLVECLKRAGFKLLEVQFLTPHLESLGAVEIPDSEYQKRLADALLHPTEKLRI